jgi:hypothetical protein
MSIDDMFYNLNEVITMITHNLLFGKIRLEDYNINLSIREKVLYIY